jgi:hypothetical protein
MVGVGIEFIRLGFAGRGWPGLCSADDLPELLEEIRNLLVGSGRLPHDEAQGGQMWLDGPDTAH